MRARHKNATVAVLTTLGLLLTVCQVAEGSEPLEAIPIPLYTFDGSSPTLEPGMADLHADEIFEKVQGELFPTVRFSAANLGLGRMLDDLNSISTDRGDVGLNTSFLLMFSVDRLTAGNVPADPSLEGFEVPFTVADQSNRNHAAGDAFVSHSLFDRFGKISRFRDLQLLSNTQVINNYDEGGHDFQAAPSTSSTTLVPGGTSQDNVNGMASGQDSSTSGFRTPVPIYFTVGADSQSLDGFLPGDTSADIFFDPLPNLPGLQSMPYVMGVDLGLSSFDAVDALVVMDEGVVGVFDAGDLVLFSLAPGSPSLNTIPDVSSNGAADVFAAFVGTNGGAEVFVFAHACNLGLMGDFDNVDALEIVPCASDPLQCAAVAGIRLVRGDWNNNSVVDIDDFLEFAQCLGGPLDAGNPNTPSQLCLDYFDFDRDRDVDLEDFAGFQIAFGMH